MKRRITEITAFFLCVAMLVLGLTSCSEEPYQYDLDDHITVPNDFTAIKLTDEEIRIGVSEKIAAALENSAESQTVVDRAIVSGDTVTLNVRCYYLDTYAEDKAKGNVIKAISDPSCNLKPGAGKYPMELEKAVIGKTTGDTFIVQLTLPSMYTVDALGGKNVVYECTVIEVKHAIIPPYDDEFVKKVSSLNTTDEYEQMLYEAVKEELIYEKLLQLCSFKSYPTDEVSRYASDFISYYTEVAEGLELTLEEYVSRKFFIELNEFHLQADTYAKDIVKSELLMYYLVRNYDLEITSAEYSAGAREYAAKYGLASVSALESKFGFEHVRRTVQLDKVMKYLSSQVTIPATEEAS